MTAFGVVRGEIKTEEFDYEALLQTLQSYKKPRDAITRFLRDESIIRVKKGLYVFGENYRKGLICRESIANLRPNLLRSSLMLSEAPMLAHNVIEIK